MFMEIFFQLLLCILLIPVMNIILCRCTPCTMCQAAQCSVGFSNRLKFSNFLIGNNAIIHVPLYQLPSCCLALLTIWRSWCTLSQRSVQKERCYTTLKNKSSKEEVSDRHKNVIYQSWHNICWVLTHFKYMQCSLPGYYLQMRHQHWLSTHSIVIGTQEWWRAVTDGLNWGKRELILIFWPCMEGFFIVYVTLWATCKGT